VPDVAANPRSAGARLRDGDGEAREEYAPEASILNNRMASRAV
jgi:hypothetical protein